MWDVWEVCNPLLRLASRQLSVKNRLNTLLRQIKISYLETYLVIIYGASVYLSLIRKTRFNWVLIKEIYRFKKYIELMPRCCHFFGTIFCSHFSGFRLKKTPIIIPPINIITFCFFKLGDTTVSELLRQTAELWGSFGVTANGSRDACWHNKTSKRGKKWGGLETTPDLFISLNTTVIQSWSQTRPYCLKSLDKLYFKCFSLIQNICY